LKRDTVFFRQAELLLRVLPFVNQEEIFALKGGTAINFFLRDLPRLSVDIDLTYLPINDRKTALTDIDKALLRISERVKKTIPGVRPFSKRDREKEGNGVKKRQWGQKKGSSIVTFVKKLFE